MSRNRKYKVHCSEERAVECFTAAYLLIFPAIILRYSSYFHVFVCGSGGMCVFIPLKGYFRFLCEHFHCSQGPFLLFIKSCK